MQFSTRDEKISANSVKRDIERYRLRFKLGRWKIVQKLFGDHAEQVRKQLENLRRLALDVPIKGKSPEWVRFDARFASSAILRSENQLFGLTIPRFAVRVYLDEGHQNFANVRRIAEFFARLGNTQVQSLSKVELEQNSYQNYKAIDENANDFSSLANDSWNGLHVADAHIVPPKNILGDFDVLTVDLGREYGEGIRSNATPFAASLTGIGGGTCAQAVIYMASTLLLGMSHQERAEWPRVCVHGPGEITVIANQDPSRRLIRLRGLRPRSIASYFTRTGRSCLVQQNSHIRMACLTRDRRIDFFEETICAYLRAGVPVILPLNADRLYSNDPLHAKLPGINHAIVILGFERQENKLPKEFIVNDPNRPPFQKHPVGTLWNASMTWQTIDTDDLGRMVIVPLPERVRLPIETPCPEKEGDSGVHPGLIDLAILLQTDLPDAPARRVPQAILESESEFDLGNLALTRIVGATPFDAIKKLGILDPDTDADEALARKFNVELSPWQGRWCYVQFKGEKQADIKSVRSLWIWDAEMVATVDASRASQKRKQAARHVISVFWRGSDEGVWQVDTRKPDGREKNDLALWYTGYGIRKQNPPAKLSMDPAFSPIVITSLSTIGTDRAVHRLQRHQNLKSVGLDLYAFMHREKLLREVFNHTDDGNWSVVEHLARLADDKTRRVELADRICSLCKGQTIRAVTSSLPEIASTNDSTREQSIKASIALVELAFALRERRHDVRVISFVCGSRVGAIGHAFNLSDGRKDYFAVMRNDVDLLNTLASSVTEIVTSSSFNKYVDDPNPPLVIGLELEPGPLYAVNNTTMLKKLGERLIEGPCRRIVGWNLDAAHFHMADVSMAAFASDSPDRRLLRDRIVHAHLSDHGAGLFGNVSLSPQYRSADECPRRWMQDWLDLLKGIATERRTKQDESLPLSGLLSIELEAVRSERMVAESIAELQ